MARLVCFLLTPLVLCAQPPARFEVSTVKRNTDFDAGSRIGVRPGGGFIAGSVTLRRLIRTAYNRNVTEIVGGPAWLDSLRWDIAANAEGLTEPVGPAQMMPLLQQLLADRFQLRLHRETREGPVYELRVAKSGPKLKPSTAGIPLASFRNAQGSIRATKATVAELASVLARPAGRPVLDRTGLQGVYDVVIEWTPDSEIDPAAGAPLGLSLFTALQEQAGLRLEAAKGPVEILVVDSAQLPDEN